MASAVDIAVSGSPYDREFYRELDATAAVSARVVVPMVLELATVRSVVDVGCGDGGWLSVFREHAVDDVLGIDGPWIAPELLKIPLWSFRCQRLNEPVTLDRRFDLAMSLEVAEHLPEARAGDFVAELTALAPVVLFSAAIPGQGGRNHLNEQWPEYWHEHFERHGYRGLDPIRPAIWSRGDVTWCYKQNLLLFANAAALGANSRLRAVTCQAAPPALVHPECFAGVVKRADPGLGRWLKMGPRALGRALGRRVTR